MEETPRPAGPAPRRYLPGEAGTWVFVYADIVLFSAMFVAFMVERRAEPQVFANGQDQLNALYGVINTMLLLVSSWLVALAVRAVRRGETAGVPRLLLVASACGILFSGFKLLEYTQKHGIGVGPMTDDFFMYYFILTGVHWFHLICGLLLLWTMALVCRRKVLTARQQSFVETGATFWHMVDLLWLVLFPVVYLV